jgi:hypothetical protein
VVLQALQGQSITIYGEGQQTRSFQYVDDLVDGLIKVSELEDSTPPVTTLTDRACRAVFLPRLDGHGLMEGASCLCVCQLMNGPYDLPVNLGNPDEYRVSPLHLIVNQVDPLYSGPLLPVPPQIRDFAHLILELVGGNSTVVHLPATK